jgi:hypothetical protein
MKGAGVKGILLSLMAVLLVSGMTGVAYAWPDGNNDRNRFSHHNLDLKLKDQDEPWGDGVSATWTATDMAPGGEFAFDGSFVGLQGNVPGKVDITCDYAVEEEFPQTKADTDPETDLHPGEMAKYMVITRCIYKDDGWQIDCLTGEFKIMSWRRNGLRTLYINDDWQVKDAEPDGKITFYDLKQSPLTNLPSPGGGCANRTRFEMSVKFHQDAGNEFQGDIFTLTMIYTLEPRQCGGWSYQSFDD